jgi:hypothetical protein
MKTRFLALLLGAAVSPAAALTVSGTVEGNAGGSRIGAFAVTPFGQTVQEVVSAPITAGQFRLEVPGGAPAARAQAPLSPQNVSWPGVIDPVQVSAAAQVAELRLFVYADANGNGHRDEGEGLREVTPMLGNSALFITWVSGDVTVTAGKGYRAELRKGWNAFVVDVGRTVRVQPFDEDRAVNVRMGR